MVYASYKAVGMDEKGVMLELFCLPFIVASVYLLGWIFVMVDIKNLSYLKIVNWNWFFFVATLLHWFVSFGCQYYYHVKCLIKTSRAKRVEEGSKLVDMKTTLKNNPEIKNEFYEFAKKQFVVEAINFMEDVDQYKTLFYEKAGNWRKAKFKILVETYILPGSNFEINISYTMRNRVTKVYHHIANNPDDEETLHDLFQVFDESAKEIEKNLNDGNWRDFMHKYKLSRMSSKSTRFSVAVHNIL